MPFRFVHTADVHLDSPLRSLALRDPELAELVGVASRQAFARTIDLALSERVDALLLAGDLYDGEQTSMKTARFLAEEMRRLHEAGIRAFIIRGNHDALSKITKELTFPEGTVNVFGGRAETVSLTGSAWPFEVAVHGLSFAKPTAPESLLPRFKPPVADAVNIGLMHTSLGGAPGHDAYAPCSPGDLDGHGFDYWALGHIHKRSVAGQRSKIVMPGMPQGRDVGESGAKSVELVTIADDRSIRIEERYTAIAQFEPVRVALDGIEAWEEVIAAIGRALARAHESVQSEHLVARLALDGVTPLAWRIRRDSDVLEEEARDQALILGKSWIEGVEVTCRNPDAAINAGPVAELRRLIDEEVTGSAAFTAEIVEIAKRLSAQLPRECRALLGADEGDRAAALAKLGRDGSEEVMARLAGGIKDEAAPCA